MKNDKIDQHLKFSRYSKELINNIIRLREHDNEAWHIIAPRVGVSVQTARALYRRIRGTSKKLPSLSKDDVLLIIKLRDDGLSWQEIKDRLSLDFSAKGLSKIYYKHCRRVAFVKERDFKMPIMRSDINEAMRIACEISGVRDNFYQSKQW